MSTQYTTKKSLNGSTVGSSLVPMFSKFTKDYASLVAILLLGIVFSILVPEYFLTWDNFTNILLQASTIAIVAIGQALVLTTGQFDLSLGQIVCVTSIVATVLMKTYSVNTWLALLIALLLGAILGLTNGVLFAYCGIPAFIATLGVQNICRGSAKLITNATPIARLPEEMGFIGRGYVGPVPVSVIIMLILYIVVQFISRKTKLGRNFYAIGGNSEAAFFAGINIRKYYCIAFMMAGIFAAIGGIVLMSRLNSVSITNGNLYEFDAVIASIIGGISLTGGKGKVIGAMFGSIFLILFFNGMTMLNVDPYIQDVLKGVVLIIAIGIDVFRNRMRA